jgi:hypothetical protein
MDEAALAMARNLEQKTGKTIKQWVALARKSGESKHNAIIKHLKEAHGLTHGYANFVAHSASGVLAKDAPAGEALVDAQYQGEKAALRPVYEKLVKEIRKFGKGIEISPKKTYVSLRRAKQFALIQPSTKTRVDVGINLKGAPVKGRLEASGSFNAMVSHRVRVEKAADANAELVGWLKKAYEAAK